MNTACKLCHYAIYEDKTQTGCQFNRIDAYKKNSEVIEAYDNEKEFYVIKDRQCNLYNPWKWFDADKAREIVNLQYDLYIISNKESLIDCSLNFEVKIQPQNIYIGYSDDYNNKLIDKYSSKYKFSYILGNRTHDEVEYELAKQAKSAYYIPLYDGQPLDAAFVEECDKLYNDEMVEFVYRENINELILRRATLAVGGFQGAAPGTKKSHIFKQYFDPKYVV